MSSLYRSPALHRGVWSFILCFAVLSRASCGLHQNERLSTKNRSSECGPKGIHILLGGVTLGDPISAAIAHYFSQVPGVTKLTILDKETRSETQQELENRRLSTIRMCSGQLNPPPGDVLAALKNPGNGSRPPWLDGLTWSTVEMTPEQKVSFAEQCQQGFLMPAVSEQVVEEYLMDVSAALQELASQVLIRSPGRYPEMSVVIPSQLPMISTLFTRLASFWGPSEIALERRGDVDPTWKEQRLSWIENAIRAAWRNANKREELLDIRRGTTLEAWVDELSHDATDEESHIVGVFDAPDRAWLGFDASGGGRNATLGPTLHALARTQTPAVSFVVTEQEKLSEAPGFREQEAVVISGAGQNPLSGPMLLSVALAPKLPALVIPFESNYFANTYLGITQDMQALRVSIPARLHLAIVDK